jgi:hypothetical protein
VNNYSKKSLDTSSRFYQSSIEFQERKLENYSSVIQMNLTLDDDFLANFMGERIDLLK